MIITSKCPVFLDTATLTEVFPCFFLGCKANARVILAKTGHGPHSSKIVVFYVLFVCKCVLPPGDNPIAVNKYIIKSIETCPTFSSLHLFVRQIFLSKHCHYTSYLTCHIIPHTYAQILLIFIQF